MYTYVHTYHIRYIYHITNTSSQHGHFLNLLATPVTLCQGWQSGSNIPVSRLRFRPSTPIYICARGRHNGIRNTKDLVKA